MANRLKKKNAGWGKMVLQVKWSGVGAWCTPAFLLQRGSVYFDIQIVQEAMQREGVYTWMEAYRVCTGGLWVGTILLGVCASGFCLFGYLPVHMPACLSVCLSVCLFVYVCLSRHWPWVGGQRTGRW